MYAAHLGWLHSVPEKAENCRINSLPDSSPSRVMPTVFDDSIVKVWGLLNYSNTKTSGPEELGFGDISSFIEATGYRISPFAVTSIKEMSSEYVLWLMKGRAASCTQPYININSNNDAANSDIASRIRAMARNRRK